jgi:predicted phage tail protein
MVKLTGAKAALALIAVVLLTGLSCGKRKPPLPPTERVVQRVDLSGFQRGSQIILSWKMPDRNADKSSVMNIDRADIYRLAEPLSSPQALSEEEFASRSTLIASFRIRETDFGGKTLNFTDTLQFAGQAARLRYAIRFVNTAGQKAAFSNFFLFEPATRIAGAPTSLSAVVTQEAIELEWAAPVANVDGSRPASLLGYNVYRSESEKTPARLLNKTPLADTNFDDQFFDFDKPLFYFVRSVSVGTGGEPVESSESNILQLTPKDTFAPSAPEGITLAATPTSISIFFATNTEKDVVGYRIYRSEDPAADKKSWQLLTPTPLTTNTYQDSGVAAGRTYFYYLTAIDKAGNVSEASQTVSETVP